MLYAMVEGPSRLSSIRFVVVWEQRVSTASKAVALGQEERPRKRLGSFRVVRH